MRTWPLAQIPLRSKIGRMWRVRCGSRTWTLPTLPPGTGKRVGYAEEASHYVEREVGPGPLHSAPHPDEPRVQARLLAALSCWREGEGSGVGGNTTIVEGRGDRTRYI
jgi:hypothetical protein